MNINNNNKNKNYYIFKKFNYEYLSKENQYYN